MPTIKQAEYDEFLTWTALPSRLRTPKTQQELARKLKVDPSTLSDWKREQTFWQEVNERIWASARDRNSDVIDALYQGILRTKNPSLIKIWLEHFGQFLDEPQKLPPLVLVKFIGKDSGEDDKPDVLEG